MLPTEVEMIWKRKYSAVTFLYVIIRYCALYGKLATIPMLFALEPLAKVSTRFTVFSRRSLNGS